MNKTLRTESSNINIINFVMIIGVFVFLTMGCQQINDAVNGTKPANTNTATNSNASTNANANTNSNSNVTANSNANANTSVASSNSAANANSQASNTAANTATATKEEKPLTAAEQKFKDTLVGEWKDNRMTVTFTETEFSAKLNNGTVNSGPYKIVDEHNIEATLTRTNVKFKATMSFEDNGKTLNWTDPTGTFKYTRVK